MGRRQTMGTAKGHYHPYRHNGIRIDKRGAAQQKPTKKQREILSKFKLSIPATKKEASSVISSLANNGWKLDSRTRAAHKARKRQKTRGKRKRRASKQTGSEANMSLLMCSQCEYPKPACEFFKKDRNPPVCRRCRAGQPPAPSNHPAVLEKQLDEGMAHSIAGD